MANRVSIRLAIDEAAARSSYMAKSLALRGFCDRNRIPLDPDVYDFDFLHQSCRKDLAVAKYAELELECIRAIIAASGKALVSGKWLVAADFSYEDGIFVPNEIVINADDSIDILFDDANVAVMFKLSMGSLN